MHNSPDTPGWQYLRRKVYVLNDSYLEMYIKESTAHDLEKWINWVNQNCFVGWNNPLSDKVELAINFELVKRGWQSPELYESYATIHLDEVEVHVGFYSESEFIHEINPGTICSIEDHHRLMNYCKTISLLLGKEVMITPEGLEKDVLIRVSGESIEIK